MEPYNQCIKGQVATKNIKKEDRLCMKSPQPEGCGDITWHSLWNLLTINFNGKSFHNFIE